MTVACRECETTGKSQTSTLAGSRAGQTKMHDPGRMSDVTLLLTLLSTVLPMLSAAGDAYASEEKAHEKPPRFAYATLMVGAADKQERVRLWEPDAPHNLNVFNRTLCFQQRLHALGARHPLVVIHNFDFDEKESKAMAAQFDQMHKVVPSDESVTRRSAALLSAEVHLHKFAVWALTEWDRIIYIDSDVRSRSRSADIWHPSHPCRTACCACSLNARSVDRHRAP